jgi:crotonobetainyl-CoA:carnitine CoA-transferase CaiB-like acyl-CoA transferase
MSGPLDSLKVLDFTTLLPGPFATMTLADLGADVVRIEAPGRPDMTRLIPPYDGDTSVWHAVLNRNKRSLALDLKQPGAAEVVRRLVSPESGYDIVIEQFRPEVMDRLGVGYAALAAANPRLIYVALTGYGQTGPYRDRAGHDINFLALSGAMSHSGRQGAGPPPLGVQLADFGGSFGALVGLLSAVIQRGQTGRGQFIDISMADLMVHWQAHIAGGCLVAGETPRPEDALLNGGHWYDYYKTQDDRYLAVASLEPSFWAGFCAAVDRPDLLAAGQSMDPADLAAVKAAIGETIRRRPLAEWLVIFEGLDVCVEPVLTVPEMLAHPHTQARGLVVNVPRPDGRPQSQIASPYKFSDAEPVYRHTGTAAGAHTDEVLQAAGYSAEAVAELRAAGVVAS